jgi:hypothetical protein
LISVSLNKFQAKKPPLFSKDPVAVPEYPENGWDGSRPEGSGGPIFKPHVAMKKGEPTSGHGLFSKDIRK